MNYYKPLAMIAGVMLLLAVPPMWPYAYYQILRDVVCIVAVILAIAAFNGKQHTWVWIMGIIAVVFNPLAPVYLSKGTWVLLDIVAAGCMFIASRTFEGKDV